MPADPIARGLGAKANTAAGISAAGGMLSNEPPLYRPPTPSDDSTKGYAVGNLWYDARNKVLYTCQVSTAGAARWVVIDGPIALPADYVGGTAPIGLYGTVRLKASYTSNLFRIVRASDSTTLDVGQVWSGSIGNYIADMAAAVAFLAGTTGKIDKWYDQSGNANDATQTVDANRPSVSFRKINGRPIICFDGRSWDNTNFTRFFDLPAGVAVNRQTFSAMAIGQCADGNAKTLVEFDASSSPSMTVIASGVWSVNTGSSGNTSVFCRSEPGVFGAVTSASVTTLYHNEKFGVTTAPSSVSCTGGRIGNSNRAAGAQARMDMVGMAIYARTFTALETLNFRKAGYALLGMGPQRDVHIVLDGDSIAVGRGATDLLTPLRRFERLINRPVSCINLAVGGQTLATCDTNYAGAGHVEVAYETGKTNILVLHASTNDIAASATAATTFAKWQSYGGKAVATGYAFIATTCLPRTGWSGAQQTEWTAYNVLMRAGYSAYAVALIDGQADATLGPLAAASDTSLYVDGVHLSDLANSIYSQIWTPQLNTRLLKSSVVSRI